MVTWADSEDCPNCPSIVSKKRRGFWFRIRIYVLIGLGCITIFGVYRYARRPLPPSSEELRPVFQGIAESNFTSTARINRATSELYDVVSIKAGRYELMNPEISEEGGVYGYSADFVLWTDATDGRSGPGFNGRIKFELVEGKWKNPTYHLNSVR